MRKPLIGKPSHPPVMFFWLLFFLMFCLVPTQLHNVCIATQTHSSSLDTQLYLQRKQTPLVLGILAPLYETIPLCMYCTTVCRPPPCLQWRQGGGLQTVVQYMHNGMIIVETPVTRVCNSNTHFYSGHLPVFALKTSPTSACL